MEIRSLSGPKWKGFRLRVRRYLLVILLLGGALGWFVRIASVQHDAVQAIRRAGGMVSYEWEWKSGRYDWRPQPPCPGWLVSLIGVDGLYNVEMVSLRETGADAVLAQVAKLTRLKILDLQMVHVSDSGMANLEGLTALETLSIQSPGVSDSGLVNLKSLARLKVLGLRDARVTGAGLAHLKGLTELSSLYLCGTQVTDTGLVNLRALPRLKNLCLCGTKVTNAGLTHLREMPSLDDLSLASTTVDDGSMGVLKEMTTLKLLDLSFTLFSWPGSSELHHALPGTTIENSPLHWSPGRPEP